MRLLFTSTSGMGHFNPLVRLIQAAVARGDDVLVVGPPKLEPVLAVRDQAYRIGAAPAEAEASALAHTVPAPSPYPATRRFREAGPADADGAPSAPLPDWWVGSNAPLVESAGAGLAVEPTGEPKGRVGVPAPGDAPRIRRSLESVLADDSYRRAARGLAAEMSALPTARDLLGALQSELASAV